MHTLRKLFAITLLALVVGTGTPAAFADGTAESPGIISTQGTDTGTSTTVTAEGTAESPGFFGVAESPGIMATITIYLGVVI